MHRGVKVALDPTLLKKTQEERHIERETKEAEKQAEKEKKTAAAAKKKVLQQEAGVCIAAIEDNQVKTAGDLLALRPDIAKGTSERAAICGRGGHAAARAVPMAAPSGASGTRGAIHGGSRDTARDSGHTTTCGGATARGGCGIARGGHAIARGGCGIDRGGHAIAHGGRGFGHGGRATAHGGKKSARPGLVEELLDASAAHKDDATNDYAEPDVEPSKPIDEYDIGEVSVATSDVSDVDMPPATELDTESEGGVEGGIKVELEDKMDKALDASEDEAGDAVLEVVEFDDDADKDYRDEEEEYDNDGNGDGDSEVGKRVVKRQSEPKEAKLAICQDIVATHTIKPTQLVQPLKNAKRRGSNVGNEQSKKRVKATVGGLDKDWKSVYGNKSAATSSSSVVSTRSQSSDGIIGEFDVEESTEATETSRQTKLGMAGGIGKPKQTVVDIKLVPANIAEIDRKDHVKRIPGTAGRHNVPSSKNLPFVYPQDKQIWENHFLPELYGWQGVVKEQFSSSSHAEFNSIVQNAWLRWFDHLPPQYQDAAGVICERVDHPAIQSVVQATLSTYQTDLANKKALLYVEQKMNKDVEPEEGIDMTEYRKLWVQAQLQGMSILYEFPDDDEANTKPSGLFKSEVFLKTLAYHLYKICDSGKYVWFGHPAGALALSAAAIKRALTIWKDGIKPKMKPDDDVDGDGEKKLKQATRNGPTSFSQC
ncbi:hypothetical protein VKT23_019387 [Stygiomarasmius scandens]|uniref:DUF6532 domain-containing protein n=1 Tax=Marasmiellus scandens TaxID=2682957 RepID=A0ABR1IPM1_9AGAR